MVYGSYPCSTVSWLQIEPLDLFWVPSIPMIWSFKKVVSSFLCIIILIWRHQGKTNQNAVPAVQRSVPNIIRRPVCHMKALEVYFHLVVVLGLIAWFWKMMFFCYCTLAIVKTGLFWRRGLILKITQYLILKVWSKKQSVVNKTISTFVAVIEVPDP